MPAHVDLREVSKDFCGRIALDGINLSVQHGDFLALVGPNGAGKTTLLRIIDLLEEPSSGEVWLNGERVDYSRRDLHVIRREIGFVPQRPILFNASVFDNIAYGLKVRGLNQREIKEKVKDILDLVQLSGFEYRNALKLSGGEMQRISLAQALVTGPRLLLLDEPTSNLDPRSASIIEGVLMEINRYKGTTIIMTSHDLEQVRNLARRIAILNRGRIVKVGSSEEIFANPPDQLLEYTKLENVFSGIARETEYGTSVIEIDEGLKIEAAFTKTGPVRVYVPPESITLLSERIQTSARNIFGGTISEITDYGNIVKVKVKIKEGKEITAKITKKSLEEMKLTLGTRVFIAFKASSVKAI